MKITIFTKKSLRHKYLINSISKIANKVFVVEENISFKDRLKNKNIQSNIKKKYFQKVINAEKKIFKKKFIKKKIKNFLQSELYIVFGSSYIKGKLINFLIKNKAINIHMGISPYYRGSDCNFWALYDNNPHLVGGTIHMISKGLDSGPIIYHALAKKNKNSFIYSMLAVKSTIDSLVSKIKNNKLNLKKTTKQNKNNEIRYTRKSEFTDQVIKNFMKKKIKLHKLKKLKKIYINPTY